MSRLQFPEIKISVDMLSMNIFGFKYSRHIHDFLNGEAKFLLEGAGTFCFFLQAPIMLYAKVI